MGGSFRALLTHMFGYLQALDPYSGPLTTRLFPNLYIFLLYKQDATINVTQNVTDSLIASGGLTIRLDTFLDAVGLKGNHYFKDEPFSGINIFSM